MHRSNVLAGQWRDGHQFGVMSFHGSGRAHTAPHVQLTGPARPSRVPERPVSPAAPTAARLAALAAVITAPAACRRAYSAADNRIATHRFGHRPWRGEGANSDPRRIGNCSERLCEARKTNSTRPKPEPKKTGKGRAVWAKRRGRDTPFLFTCDVLLLPASKTEGSCWAK
jgi:hypothetical protein